MSYQSEVLADSPTAYYRLNDSPVTGGSTCIDLSGNSRNGTYQQTNGGSVSGYILSDPTNKAVNFANGTSSGGRVDLPNAAWSPTTGAWTVEWWTVCPASVGRGGTIAQIRDSGTGQIRVQMYGDGTPGGDMTFRLNTNAAFGGGQIDLGPHPRLQTGAVLYNAVTCTGAAGALNIFTGRQGIDATAANWAGAVAPATTYTMGAVIESIMAGFEFFGPAAQYVGSLDEVAFYTTALNNTRIQAHYQAASAVQLGGQYTGGRLQLSMQGWVQ